MHMKHSLITKRQSNQDYIASFDIGIKNLACCIFTPSLVPLPGREIDIVYWNVLDLMYEPICIDCNSAAYYTYKDETFCKTHARKRKLSLVCEILVKPKTKALDMQSLCSRMVIELDKIEALKNVSLVLLENQPSKNPKMKNLSFMLYSYFVIRNLNRSIKILFVNPRNKLEIYDGPYVPCNLKGQYPRNKFYGKIYCKYFVRNIPSALKFFESFKKRDDLADCMLQGVWYTKKNKLKEKSSGHKRINNENTWIRFKDVRAYKPRLTGPVSLANLKYAVFKDRKWYNNARYKNSAEFFFGSVEFLKSKLETV